jgi:hypothetical protein
LRALHLNIFEQPQNGFALELELKNQFVKPLLNQCLQDVKDMREKQMFFYTPFITYFL